MLLFELPVHVHIANTLPALHIIPLLKMFVAALYRGFHRYKVFHESGFQHRHVCLTHST